MAIKAIIWDIGGVLSRTEDRTPRTHLAEQLGLTYVELEDLIFNAETGHKAQLGKAHAEEVWAEAADHLGLPAARIPELQEAFFGGDVLDIALIDTIRSLHESYASGIISNAFDNTRKLLTDEWQIVDAFDCIILSAEVGVMKPDAQIFRLALDELSVKPVEAVFLDDFQHNVQGALEVGMQAIHFRSRDQALRELKSILAEGSRNA